MLLFSHPPPAARPNQSSRKAGTLSRAARKKKRVKKTCTHELDLLEKAGRRGNSFDSRALVVELKEVEEEGEAALKAFVGFGLLGKVQCVVRDWGTK